MVQIYLSYIPNLPDINSMDLYMIPPLTDFKRDIFLVIVHF